ncbi:MAG: enoyl-CoA hydratase [Acidimicrobiia bacterium]|nr:enoyl-CoA hydratase [Acidimicrobiia bacterium]MYC44980.1 enoyl-CoA hydratase [Acidimicrobiia bacterium]MYI21033.1 enoyl-CoA hydratase [Acidimicrobiia bacterium]
MAMGSPQYGCGDPAGATVTDPVRLEIASDIAHVTLNRPDKLNALSSRLLGELVEVLERVAGDPAVRVVILSGAGRAFSAGGDRDETGEPWGVSLEADTALLRRFMESSLLLHEMDAVTIAAVNGPCAGGALALACACDLRYAATSARFVTAFARVGLSGDFGGTATMAWVLGPAKARELYLLSEVVEAPEAERIGLVSQVVPDDELLPHVQRIAERLLSAAPGALVAMKQNLNDGLRLPLAEVLDREAERQVRCTRDPTFDERYGLQGR